MASAAVHDPPPTYEESLELRTIRSQGNSSCAATSTTELILGSPDLFTEEGEASVSNVQLTRPPPRRHVPDAATWEMLDTLSRKESFYCGCLFLWIVILLGLCVTLFTLGHRHAYLQGRNSATSASGIRQCPVRVLLFHTSDVYKRVRDLNLISTSLDILENAPGNCDADNAIIMDRDGELWKGDLVLRSRRNEVEFVITNGDDPPLPSEFENITILTQYGQIVNNSVIMRPSLQAKFTSIMDRALRSQVREFFVIVSDDQWYYEGILTEFIHFVKASGLENYLAFKVFLLQAPSSNNSKLRDRLTEFQRRADFFRFSVGILLLLPPEEIKLVLTTASDLEGFPLDVPWFSLEGPQYPNLFTVEDVNDSDLRDKKSSAISDKAASFARSVGFFSPIEVSFKDCPPNLEENASAIGINDLRRVLQYHLYPPQPGVKYVKEKYIIALAFLSKSYPNKHVQFLHQSPWILDNYLSIDALSGVLPASINPYFILQKSEVLRHRQRLCNSPILRLNFSDPITCEEQKRTFSLSGGDAHPIMPEVLMVPNVNGFTVYLHCGLEDNEPDRDIPDIELGCPSPGPSRRCILGVKRQRNRVKRDLSFISFDHGLESKDEEEEFSNPLRSTFLSSIAPAVKSVVDKFTNATAGLRDSLKNMFPRLSPKEEEKEAIKKVKEFARKELSPEISAIAKEEPEPVSNESLQKLFTATNTTTLKEFVAVLIDQENDTSDDVIMKTFETLVAANRTTMSSDAVLLKKFFHELAILNRTRSEVLQNQVGKLVPGLTLEWNYNNTKVPSKDVEEQKNTNEIVSAVRLALAPGRRFIRNMGSFLEVAAPCTWSMVGCMFCFFAFTFKDLHPLPPVFCANPCFIVMFNNCGVTIGSGAGVLVGHSVICTELYEQGQLDLETYLQEDLAASMLDQSLLRGYHLWGKPLANVMRKSEVMSIIIQHLAQPWFESIAKNEVDNSYALQATFKILRFVGVWM